jgi:hypothetical protein
MSVTASLPEFEQATRQQRAPVDWVHVENNLDARGFAVSHGLLIGRDCREMASLYPDDAHFRSRVVMAKHGFGRGEYKYFSYPLPAPIARLRTEIYPHLARIANRWNEIIGIDEHYPSDHAAFLELCHNSGQTRPTPLLFEYGPGDFNCLHQDLYGDLVFPFQVAILLSKPGEDFAGGEFVLTEQRPRMQSKASVVSLQQGDAVVFPVHYRPVRGARGYYRVNMRHGVSEVLSGRRHTLGIIFHDAK